MTPSNIAGMAKLAGYDVIALSDHNSSKNIPAFLSACKQYDIIGIPAMEITTREEVHVLCLFPDEGAVQQFEDYIYKRLPDIKNDTTIFGNQLIIDENDNVIGEEIKLLISATDIGIYQLNEIVNNLGGVAIPAHIDRSSFSILSHYV
jgi:PHP family Zn ribbon phosphoesterase